MDDTAGADVLDYLGSKAVVQNVHDAGLQPVVAFGLCDVGYESAAGVGLIGFGEGGCTQRCMYLSLEMPVQHGSCRVSWGVRIDYSCWLLLFLEAV